MKECVKMQVKKETYRTLHVLEDCTCSSWSWIETESARSFLKAAFRPYGILFLTLSLLLMAK
jgi:hypothetical protein